MKRTFYLTKGIIFGKCSDTEPPTKNIKPFNSAEKNLIIDKESGSVILNWCTQDLEAEIFSNR